MTKKVAKNQESQVSNYDYSRDGGSGFENITSEDMAVPFMYLTQSLSHQAKGKDSVAKEGDFYNSVTGRVYPDGFTMIPCLTKHNYIERDDDDNFRGVHEKDSDVVVSAKANGRSFGKIPLGNGNYLIETFSVFALIIDGESVTQAILPFKSTGIKKYKNFITTARSVTMKTAGGGIIPFPLFAHRWRVTSIEQKSDKGDFANWAITFENGTAEESRVDPESDEYAMAKAFIEAVNTGNAKVNFNQDKASNEEELPI